MTKKVIAIGNRLMQDDGVALEVGERIKNILMEKEIEVIIGETDIDFCIQKIDPGDEVYIMDSTYYGIAPGSITFSNLNSKGDKQYISSTMHGFNLIDMISLYRRRISLFLIGIEIDSVEMEVGLSRTLQYKIEDICNYIVKLLS